MKKITFVALFFLLTLALTACGAKEAPAQQQEIVTPVTQQESSAPAAPTAEDTTPAAEPQNAAAGGTLVVVFSATGTTRGVAEKIASITDADLYEIVPVEPYTDADLNYNDSNSRATKEQNDKSVRPAIASETLDLSAYETIYIGYPIWWGQEPRIMDAFVESYDFSGKTLIPFCTSGSSDIGSSGKNLERLTSGATWLDGRRFGGGVNESEVKDWIEGLK